MRTFGQLILVLILFFVNTNRIYATDSLSAQTNEYLVQKIDAYQYDKNNPEVWNYIQAYIHKAKIRKDYKTLFYAYKEGIYFANDYATKLEYADSTLVTAQKTKINDFIIQSYLSKGMVCYQYKRFQPALKNFLLADQKCTDKTSAYLSYKVLFNLALIKFHLKQFNESDKLFVKCSSYYEKNKDDANHQVYFLNSLYYRGLIKQSLQEFEKAHELNLKGLELSQQINDSHFIHYFTFSNGIDSYLKKEYNNAIDILTKEFTYLNEQQDFNTLSKAYFYLGKSYEKLNNESQSITYYNKIDQLFEQHHYLDIELRSAYEQLIKYSNKNGHTDNALYYINQLLKLDQLTQQNNLNLHHTITNQYDTKELMRLKKEIESKSQTYLFLIVLITIGGSSFFIYRRVRKNRRDRDDKLMIKDGLEIPHEIVIELLLQLDHFEENKLFLQPNITLTQLAKCFKTNTTYLSKVINSQKNTNFSNYLNELKINYIVHLLETNTTGEKYSVKDLAEIGGFSTVRHFSDTFFQYTSLRPYDYIKQIKRNLKWDELNK